MADQPKQTNNTLGATLGAVLLAGLAWLANHFGLLSGSEPVATTGTGNAVTQAPALPAGTQPAAPSAATTQQPAPTKQPSQKPAAPAPAGTLFHGIQQSTYQAGLSKIENAFDKRLSDVLIECAGRVVHILPDDNEGSRHQLFLVELENEITLKVAHNIDLAPRAPIQKGDWIAFFGEYEWNDKGGVIHWTHHDPGGRHPDGWLLHEGQRYQ